MSINHLKRATIHAFALGIITGSALTGGVIMLAAPAHAEPSKAAIERAVCLLIDQNPTVPGVVTALNELTNYGLTSYQAGQVMAQSVTDQCPEYIPLLKRFIAQYGTDSTASFHGKVGGTVQ